MVLMAMLLPHATGRAQLKSSELYTAQFIMKGLVNVWNICLTINNALGTIAATRVRSPQETIRKK
jgi:hypothetical protein